MAFVFLNRGCILGIFCPKQGQGFNPQWLTNAPINVNPVGGGGECGQEAGI